MQGRNEDGQFLSLFVIVLTPALLPTGQYARIVLGQVTQPALGGTGNDTVGAAAI